MVKNPATQDPGMALASALELLIRQGYNTTPVEELADAAGISRSTFFRKFGSKEDMVFADHERILARVDDALAAATVDPLTAVAEAALMVFDQHVRNRETSLLRNRLLHQVPTLRDRELVTTHRYERSFRHHLQASLPEADGRDFGAVAYAAAVVAVHNKVLRQWLRDAGSSSDDRPDTTAPTQLARELRALVNIFRPSLLPAAVPDPGRPAVVVTVLDPGAATGQILDAVREALE
jgi:AcrR family transcriptional regulator